jgi:hypothetical protein
METPILFLIFNRPDATEKVFAEIRRAAPPRLYIAADGPRKGNANDEKLCSDVLNVVKNIDWKCDVKTLFRKENLGCRKAVSSAITWFFQNEEQGIILEDDCLPHPTFFNYCEIMLNRYKDDYRIAHIGGASFLPEKVGNGDYYYSNLTNVWGWAGWRRVWQRYDVEMKSWPEFRKTNYLHYLYPDRNILRHLQVVFDETYQGEIDTWDYQLTYLNLTNRGLSIIPNNNLISNIGFSTQATHTFKNHPYANLQLRPMERFNPPDFIIPEYSADLTYLVKDSMSIVGLLKYKASKFLKKI